MNTTVPGALVLMTNGVYDGGVTVTIPLTMRSVNGPQFTVINGGGTNRCIFLTDGASLTGFKLTNGFDNIGNGGGGVCGSSTNALLTNCIIAGNSAGFSAGGANFCTLYNCTLNGNSAGWYGGGANYCTLYNCTLSGNSTAHIGGGASFCTLYNCTLNGNSAGWYGGGGEICTFYNCIICFNTASYGADYDYSTLYYSWTGNPLFLDYNNGNLRLQSNSPCINAGTNAYVTTVTDLDGNPRIVGGTVDIGAYECQSPALLDYYNWLQTYQLSTIASAVYADSDSDGMNNWQEWRCLTDPTNALSVLKLLAPTGDMSGVTVSWQSVTNRSYCLERATNLASSPAFSSVASNLAGQFGTTTYTDTTATNGGPFFYRVGVQP